MNTPRPPLWLQKLCYRWSTPYRHDMEEAHRWHHAIGYNEGWNDCLKHMPWPYEPHTGPLQQVPPKPAVLQMAPGRFRDLVKSQPGHNTESQVLKVIPKELRATLDERLAQLERMREQKGQEKP